MIVMTSLPVSIQQSHLTVFEKLGAKPAFLNLQICANL